LEKKGGDPVRGSLGDSYKFQEGVNKKKATTHTIENDERTANTNKNPNGNSGRKENTNDDDKENQD